MLMCLFTLNTDQMDIEGTVRNSGDQGDAKIGMIQNYSK